MTKFSAEVIAQLSDTIADHLNSLNSATFITEDEWEEAYHAVDNPRDDTMLYDWDEPEDKAILAKTDKHYVWTDIDYDEENDKGIRYKFAMIAGIHYVNRIGYVITEEPWTNENLVVPYDEYEEDGEDD